MLSESQKKKLEGRLNRVGGQINGVRKMIDEDRYCMDILTQTAAIRAAVRTIEGIVMKNHLNTCVADAMRSENVEEQREKVDEVMTVVGRFTKAG
jgi:CsoR family transcriptional regulator, copper-sensing transcriptional repressor